MNNKIVETKTTVSLIAKEIEFNRINPEHYLQREADQWNPEIKNGFTATVIKNENFDPIKLNEQKVNGRSITYVMDGKQRLTTIVAFRNNEFAIGKNVERPIVEYVDKNGEDAEFDIRGKRFKDLPGELQLQFDSCQISIVTRYNCTDEDMGYDFRRYNLNKALSSAQKGFTYAEKFARQIKDVAANPFFRGDCGHYTEIERKNGTIPRIILETAMTTFHLDDWKKQAAKAGAFLSENASTEEFDKLDELFNRLYPVCDDEKYQMEFCSKNTFIFVPVFEKFTHFGINDMRFGDFLDALEADLCDKKVKIGEEETSWNLLNECRATKDKTTIVAKIELLTLLMNDFFADSKKNEEIQTDVEVNSDESIGDFVRRHVNSELTDEDVETIGICCEDYMWNAQIPMDSKLRDEANKKSMVGIVAYMQGKDFDDTEIESWLKDYSQRSNFYMADQAKSYTVLVDDIYNTTHCEA